MYDQDEFLMRLALAEAVLGRGSVEPNPMVGAVVVREGRVVSVGHHARFGGPHAEVVAMERAGDASRGATLYVSLEPCCHTGKTPPCTGAILKAGITRVVAAMTDPFPRVAGGGLEELRRHGLEVSVGVLEDEARRLNAPYLKRLVTGRPFVTAKWAMTLDGKIATATGDSRWISGERSRAIVHEIRGRMDAIAVGIGTALADNPQLTARPAGPRIAARVVLDSAARLPPDSLLATTARDIPTWVAVTDKAPTDRLTALEGQGCEILRFPGDGSIPIASLLDELGRRGETNLLVEGGGRTLGGFLDAGEVDAVEVFLAPILEGGHPVHVPAIGVGVGTMNLARRLERQEVSVLDGDVWLRGEFPHTWLEAPRV
ncbi:MAG: riboflavin biosynthesis protein RibD [Planctomycetota bacterium]|nr:riboflavin biosynthesis protein RibD [Planctomycetota bacterium]